MKKFFKQTLLLLNKFFFPFYKDKEIKILFYNLEKNESLEKEVAMFVGGCVMGVVSLFGVIYGWVHKAERRGW